MSTPTRPTFKHVDDQFPEVREARAKLAEQREALAEVRQELRALNNKVEKRQPAEVAAAAILEGADAADACFVSDASPEHRERLLLQREALEIVVLKLSADLRQKVAKASKDISPDLGKYILTAHMLAALKLVSAAESVADASALAEEFEAAGYAWHGCGLGAGNRPSIQFLGTPTVNSSTIQHILRTWVADGLLRPADAKSAGMLPEGGAASRW